MAKEISRTILLETRMGLIRVTYELLEDFLGLTGDHKITDIYAEPEDREKNQFRVKVIGPKMPRHREGESLVTLPSELLI